MENPFAKYVCSGDFDCKQPATCSLEVFQDLGDTDVRYPESQACVHIVYHCIAHSAGARDFLGLR
jgi:hypothetical protein